MVTMVDTSLTQEKVMIFLTELMILDGYILILNNCKKINVYELNVFRNLDAQLQNFDARTRLGADLCGSLGKCQ